MTKEDYMLIALELAQNAANQDEVPVGALVVDSESGEIIATSQNKSAHGGDVTDHAEILAIREACRKLGQSRLWNMDLYVTLEPCTMCAAAISFARINKVYFGATDEKGGAVVSGVKFFESKTCHWSPQYEGGICEKECSQILKDFFKQKRQEKAENN